MIHKSAGSAFSLIELLVVVAVIALLIAILLPALGQARRSGRTAACQSNLHQFGLAYESYGADNKEVIGAFSGLEEERRTATGIHATNFPTVGHCGTQARALVMSVGRISTLPEFNLGSWQGSNIPAIVEQWSHLALWEHMGEKLPTPGSACPEDRARLSWQEAGSMAQASFVPTSGPNVRNLEWFPYSSSYQLMPASYLADNPRTVSHVGFSQGRYHDRYDCTKGEKIGGRMTHEVTFPGQKVAMADSIARHGNKPIYYAYPDASQPLLFWDGSVSVRRTKDANLGWDRSNPTSAGGREFEYSPDLAFEPAPLGNRVFMPGGYYKWTRGGLRGVDFSGKQISTENW